MTKAKLSPVRPTKVKALFNLDRKADDLLDEMVEPRYRSWFVNQLIYAAKRNPNIISDEAKSVMLDKIQQ